MWSGGKPRVPTTNARIRRKPWRNMSKCHVSENSHQCRLYTVCWFPWFSRSLCSVGSFIYIRLFMRSYLQMIDPLIHPTHSLHLLFMRLCSQYADARPTALIELSLVCVFYCHSKINVDQSNRLFNPKSFFLCGCARRVWDARPATLLALDTDYWLLVQLSSQMPEPLYCLHSLLWRLCSQMLDPTHWLHPLFMRLCWQMPRP